MNLNKELIKFRSFLFKNGFNFKNIKNLDSVELIRFIICFEEEFNLRLKDLEIKNKKINFFLHKIKKNVKKK